jgi:hypothetical protein
LITSTLLKDLERFSGTTAAIALPPPHTGNGYYERISRLLDHWLKVESEIALTQANFKGRIRVDMGTTIASIW